MSSDKGKKITKPKSTMTVDLDASVGFDSFANNFDFDTFTGFDSFVPPDLVMSVDVTTKDKKVKKDKKKEDKKDKKDKSDKTEKKEKKQESKEKKEVKKDKPKADYPTQFYTFDDIVAYPYICTATQSTVPSDAVLEGLIRRLGKKRDIITKQKALDQFAEVLSNTPIVDIISSIACLLQTFYAMSVEPVSKLRQKCLSEILLPLIQLSKTSPDLYHTLYHYSCEWVAIVLRLMYDTNADVRIHAFTCFQCTFMDVTLQETSYSLTTTTTTRVDPETSLSSDTRFSQSSTIVPTPARDAQVHDTIASIHTMLDDSTT